MSDESAGHVLIADDEEGMRFMLSQLLSREGYMVAEACNGQEALDLASEREFDVIILDVQMPVLSGLEALPQIRQKSPATPVLIITAYGSAQIAHQAIAAGAYDYFSKPLDNTELRIVVKRALERRTLQTQIETLQQQGLLLQRQVETLETELGSLSAQLKGKNRFGEIVGGSKAMLEVFTLIERVGPRDVTVLILGESGTGKELVAKAVVANSPRRAMPFIKVNCAAIPEALLESELFGHERGAFTGAHLTKPGKFELADKGTILLDEIGDLPASLQAKLLRVLQEHEFERVGGTRPLKIDLRVITSTNADLAQKVAAGKFREDLYFRLNVIPIDLPPLRQRIDDLPTLVDHFVKTFAAKFDKPISGVTAEVMELFVNYSWPGNVRELENVVQRACILTQDSKITLQSLPPEISQSQPAGALAAPLADDAASITLPDWFDDFAIPLSDKIEHLTAQAEKNLIQKALEKCDHRRQAAADLLRISRKGLHNKMVRYGFMENKEG